MSTQKRLNTNVSKLAECAVMLALAFALSCAKLFEMPMGGSVTIASMLPIMLIGIKYGTVTGMSVGFVYSLTQLLQAVMSGNVFPYCESLGALTVCVAFDYIVPFTLLGLAGIFKELGAVKNPEIASYVGIVSTVALRFVCHFITGVVIWGQWAPDGMGKYLYSLLYNGAYMLPELVLTVVGAAVITGSAHFVKMMKK